MEDSISNTKLQIKKINLKQTASIGLGIKKHKHVTHTPTKYN